MSTRSLRLILADQLSDSLASLKDADSAADVLMLCEVQAEATYVKHHQKKIAFLFCAMRHFAERLRGRGFQVHYVKLDDPLNTGSFETEVERAIKIFQPQHLVLTEAGEYRVMEIFRSWSTRFALPAEIRPDDRFLCSINEFKKWARGKTQLRMEFFYREMRKRHQILMEPENEPTGGQWNYDKQNRKPPKAGMRSPKRISHPKSAITREVLSLVKDRFADHFGTLEPFHFAVTREEALIELTQFIDELLINFGDYQDAMVKGEAYLYHSLLSCYINAGLLLPEEICRQAEMAYRRGAVPLNAAEGFIRQLLGWREFVRGLYWLHMPRYANLNYFEASRSLPWFYWSGETKMVCIAEAVAHTREHAYSHHIQRLMITGNFALIAGLNPVEVCEWYLIVYADAYEWVELPNTLGMSLFGDGGIMGSKPYAASGKYINRMSNFCKSCQYDPELVTGETACPFNSLYWDFIARNEEKLGGNQRMPYVFATWHKFEAQKQLQIRERAADVLAQMSAGTL
jgi:deoxyribodipyrimidine photolyase-related protein